MGSGVEKNLTEANKWMLRAAELGLARAQMMVGGMYHQGIGVTHAYPVNTHTHYM